MVNTETHAFTAVVNVTVVYHVTISLVIVQLAVTMVTLAILVRMVNIQLLAYYRYVVT